MKRLKYVDIAKGIAIIMVIIGHSTSGVLRGTIFSFHMPLFFLLSSYTYSYSKDIKTFWSKYKKNVKHLLIPLFAVFLLKSLLDLIQSLIAGEDVVAFQWIRSLLLTLLYSSGVPITNDRLNIGSIGMLWFVVALFLGRTLYELCKLFIVNKKAITIVCFGLSFIGYFIAKTCWLPLCMDIVLLIQPFFYVGDLLKKYELNYIAKKMLLSTGFMWGGTLLIMFLLTRNYLQIAPRIYPLYPICLIGAVFGSLCIISFCYVISTNRISTSFEYLGNKSMQILFIHYLDVFWKSLWFNYNPYISAMNRVIIDLLIFLLINFVSKILKYKEE